MANDNPTEVEGNVDQPESVTETLKEESSAKSKEPEEESNTKKEDDDGESEYPDPYYPPIIYLPEIVVNSGEDGEEEVFKRRAKLYRYAHECSPPEWKERGTGDVKILKKEEDQSARIIMRREKTLKVCANHSILPWMDLKPNCGSQKAWVWKTQADYADEEPKQETLAIRFGNVENAKKFFDAFELMRNYVLKMEAKKIREEEVGEGKEKEDQPEKKDEETDKDTVKQVDAKGDQNGIINDKMADLAV